MGNAHFTCGYTSHGISVEQEFKINGYQRGQWIQLPNGKEKNRIDVRLTSDGIDIDFYIRNRKRNFKKLDILEWYDLIFVDDSWDKRDSQLEPGLWDSKGLYYCKEMNWEGVEKYLKSLTTIHVDDNEPHYEAYGHRYYELELDDGDEYDLEY